MNQKIDIRSLYDQLSDEIGPLSRLPPSEVGIILIESIYKPSRRPYHKQKLMTFYNSRNFALEQAKRGVRSNIYSQTNLHTHCNVVDWKESHDALCRKRTAG